MCITSLNTERGMADSRTHCEISRRSRQIHCLIFSPRDVDSMVPNRACVLHTPRERCFLVQITLVQLTQKKGKTIRKVFYNFLISRSILCHNIFVLEFLFYKLSRSVWLPQFQMKTKKLQYQFQIKFPFFIFPALINKHVIVESSKGLYSFCAYSFFHFAVL